MQAEFQKYLCEAFGPERAARIMEALEESPSVSVRLNPFKLSFGGSTNEAEEKYTTGYCDEGIFEGSESVGWSQWGRILKERPVFTLDPLFHAGGYYVQDSSSMFVGYVFRQVLSMLQGESPLSGGCAIGEPQGGCAVGEARPQGNAPAQILRPFGRNIRVLDLCAAPGGKTTDLAASLREAFGDGFLLISNEVMKARAGVLADNVARWGDPNVVVTSADPAAFAALTGFFDIILADVPCSGEGMFRKDEKAREQWSEETVELCAARQKRIIADVWPALAPSGALIYSTCTFNSRENDGNVRWIAENLGAEVLSPECPFCEIIRTGEGFSLAPGFVSGEGQYCAALRKTERGTECGESLPQESFLQEGSGSESGRDGVHCSPKGAKRNLKNGKAAAKADFSEKDVSALFSSEVSIKQRGELLIAVPEAVRQDIEILESAIRPLSTGVAAGEVKNGKLIPSADLALSQILKESAFPRVELDRETALSFLHRDSICLPDAPLGHIAVTYKGLGLGFVKNIGARCNNLLPMSRRILMNIQNK